MSIDKIRKESIFCPKCGIRNYSDSIYCFKCGESINIPLENKTDIVDLKQTEVSEGISEGISEGYSDSDLIGFGKLFNGYKDVKKGKSDSTNDGWIQTNNPEADDNKVVYEYKNISNQDNDKLGGCLVSFLVFLIFGAAFMTLVVFLGYSNTRLISSLSNYDTSNHMRTITFFSILIGMLSIICYILLLNKLKSGLIILIILDMITFLMMFSNIELFNLIPFAIIGGFVRYLTLGLLLVQDWKKFK